MLNRFLCICRLPVLNESVPFAFTSGFAMEIDVLDDTKWLKDGFDVRVNETEMQAADVQTCVGVSVVRGIAMARRHLLSVCCSQMRRQWE